MATPAIKTRFELDGEKEYRTAISNINQGLGVLKSEMIKVSAEFRDNASTTEALSAKGDVWQRTLATQKDKVEQIRAALENAAREYGEVDSRTMAWQKSLNTAEAAVYDTESAIRKNNDALGDSKKAAGDASKATQDYAGANNTAAQSSTGLGTVVDGLAQKFGISLPSGLAKSMNGMGALSGKAVLAAGVFAAVAAAVVAVEKALINMTHQASGSADEILTLSMTAGMGTDAIQEFRYSAELLDVSFETLESSQTRMIRSMGDVQQGAATATEAWEKLGVRVTNADGSLRNAQDVFGEAIDALGQMGNETERDALAMEIFGKSARDLNPLVVQGSDALREYAQEAHDAAYVMDSETLAALGEVDDAYQRLHNSQEAITNQLAGEFAPHMTSVLTDCKEFIENIGKALKESGTVDSFGSILESVASLLDPLGSLIEVMLPSLQLLLNPLAETIALIADTINAIVGALPWNWGSGMFSTAMGWNVSKGQLSNQQKLNYSGTSSAWNPEIGAWVGNGSGAYNASGDANFPGGASWVGENGPERVFLPRGSQILSAQESRLTTGNVYIDNITIDAKNVQEFNDIIRIVKNHRTVARMGGLA